MMYLLEGINFDDDLNGGEGDEFQFQGEKEAGEGQGFECEGEREAGEGQGGNGESAENEGQGGSGQSVDAFGANKETDFQNKQNEKIKGKRKRVEVDHNDMSESSFDDSSYGEDDSDDPSLVLEDVERSSDEDIFASKNKNRTELRAKLKKFRKEIPKKRRFQDFSVNDDDNAGWYSDPGEDSDFENVPDEAGDAKKHCYYKDTTKTKDLELVVGMKFASGKIFREVLRDCLAQSKYLAKRMEGAIRDNPNIGIAQLKNTIMRKCRVYVSKSKIKRAKREALDAIRGVDAVQYNMLWDYCETVRVNNPGSKIILRRTEGSDVFEKLYYSLHAMKQGFVEGCRPIIGLDGCFLKTVFGGQMLVAVGRDANDNMWPIALAIVQGENRENWCWFIREMLDDIGGLGTNRWSFISDRQKGLIEALRELVPDAEHRYCLRHMYANFKIKFKSAELKEFFWKAASIANKQEFHIYMKRIAEIDPKIASDVETANEWLSKIPPQHWCRAFFSVTSKCDIHVNNLYIATVDGGANEFEVDHFLDKYVVDLDKKTCTCGMFQLNAYPCCHAYAAIADRRDPIEVYIADCYKKDMYLKCYSHMIHAVPGQKEWVQTGCDPLMAPKIKKKRGRPTKARRKAPMSFKDPSQQEKDSHVGAHEEMSSASGHPNTQEDAVPSTQSSMSRNKHNVSTGANVTPTPCTVQISSKKQNLPTTAEKVTPTVCSSQTATAKVQNDGRIYQSPRNAILMGTTQTKFAPSTIEVGGSSSTLGTGLRKPTRQKKPTISQVLQNIREKSKRRPWKP
ncbi:hypothetical protein Sango_0653200 [Sesamum angolense]|uniref:SWIM-type domain-containing protein n=1 Tax=Sesamum angolense TaxID=2727404 RepID=A0AAE1X7W1_9LAMI|nr:hypothetical protein Sango_0653200 [Sesamum angolense]